MYRAALRDPSCNHRARAHGDALPDQNVAQHGPFIYLYLYLYLYIHTNIYVFTDR